MKLTAELVEAFSGTFLSPRYDQLCSTPEFHRAAWREYCSDAQQVVCVAPRDHAKSTALTFDYGLAESLFRSSDYIIIIGATEDKAAEQLGNISGELHENQDLQSEFGPFEFVSDQKTEIIVRFPDKHMFRFLARGAEQKIRGALWNGKRPNLIICDDMEDDEQVESRDRRRKFSRWFFRAARQALSMSGRIRVHGTILHEDSLLSRLQRNKEWTHLFFKAHRSFDDFGDLLWPSRWTEAKLRKRQREFIEDIHAGAAGYAQEFLNDPMDNSEAYLRRDDFIPMKEPDYVSPKIVCAAADFAVSKSDSANRTSFTIGGKDSGNILHFLDFRKGRWSPVEWIEEMFTIQDRWNPEIFWVEDGVIWKAVQRFVYEEMEKRDRFINIEALPSIVDKATRGRSLQKRHRAGSTRWNTTADGYEDARMELLRFTGTSQAILDDQFDSAATLSLGFDRLALVAEEDFKGEEEYEWERQAREVNFGTSNCTGY